MLTKHLSFKARIVKVLVHFLRSGSKVRVLLACAKFVVFAEVMSVSLSDHFHVLHSILRLLLAIVFLVDFHHFDILAETTLAAVVSHIGV